MRESKFELLRIIAMLMVLVLHANYKSFGIPEYNEISQSPLNSTFRIFAEMASISAVNIFVLISGWFGIRPSVRGFSSFVFQCLFFSVGIYTLMILIGGADLSIKGITDCFAMNPGDYWFITSYIGLYIFSPVLNAFLDRTNEKELLFVVLAFFIFQTLYSFIGGGGGFLMKGYSTLSFMGIYLLASYAKRIVQRLKCDRNIFLLGYLLAVVVLTISSLFGQYFGYYSISSRMLCYSNPLVLFAALCLLLYFNTLNFHSKLINWIAASCFAAYLLHCNPLLITRYVEMIRSASRLYEVVAIIIVWFLCAVIIDKFRIYFWDRFLVSKFNK